MDRPNNWVAKRTWAQACFTSAPKITPPEPSNMKFALSVYTQHRHAILGTKSIVIDKSAMKSRARRLRL